MAIEKMKKIRLVAVRSEREELLRELMRLGCVQITEPELNEDEQPSLKKESAGLNDCKAQYEKLVSGIDLLNKYVPAKTGLFTPKPEVTMQSVMDESKLEKNTAIADELTSLDDSIRRITADESRVRGLTEALKPWENLDVPFDMSETRTCFVLPGVIPATSNLEELEDELEQEQSESKIFKVSSDRELHYVLLVAMKENQSAVLELVRRYGFSTSSVANMKGTAKENISELGKKLEAMKTEKQELTSKLESYAGSRDDLLLCADRLLTKMERAENEERLLYTDSTFNFEGWVPVKMEKPLANVLDNFHCAWESADPTPEETPDVPVKLNNNAVTGPFSMLTEMYSLPAYNGVDPNPFLSVFFPMFFGIMLADLGYGLLLFFGGLIYKMKVKPKGRQAWAPGLIMICGISTGLFGAVTGSFFGDAISKVAGMYGHTVTVPGLIDPLNDPLQVLIGALILGFIQLIVGTAINGYMLIREGKWLDAVFDTGSLWVLFAGIALGALGITWYVAYVGLAMIVLTQGRESTTIGGKIGGGLFSLYNIASGWFGDVLSYCRLMALMLAGAVIASVFNTLGTLAGNIFVFIILFLIGHALNLGLNIIGSFVHSLRLQYLEFFGKFYREGGKPYQPLAVKTNYFNIIEED